MEEGFNLNWDEGPAVSHREEVISGVDGTPNSEYVGVCEEVVVQDVGSETIVTDQIIHDHGQTAQNIVYMPSGAGNIVYMTQNNVVVVQQEDQNVIPEQAYMECQVTEEVVTDDWIQPQGDERVEIIGGTEGEQNEDDVEIPIPTDQDENITSRPHPCDFCSRRFRKKANLINHLVAHQTDRPHGCNLCGSRYIRKCDLMNHLKIHAYVPDTDDFDDDDMNFPLEPEPEPEKPYKKKSTSKKHKGAKIKIKDEIEEEKYSSVSRSYDYVDEDMRLLSEMAHQSATRVGYETMDYSDMIPPENHPVSEPRYPITDPRKPFVCQHCGVGFAREKALASHARIHGGDSPFECETCGDMFWDLALLREHVRNKHSDLAGNMSYDDDDDEDYVEDDDKYGDFFCQTCGMIFHRQYLLRRHSKIHIKEEYVNESEFGHVCNVCGDSFPEALDLLAHAEVHARLDVHRCMQCGESFSEEQLLAGHVSQRHSKTMAPNSCMLCGKTCKDRRTLLKHSWEHSREKTFACSKCGKSFHNKARLKRHMVSHRNKAVTCNVCGEDFPDGRSLMNHRHSHNNLAGRQFPCRECGKTFGSRSSQQIHIRIHTGERPYACRFCWKAFADGGTLRKHERIHTGEKPYACAVCPRAFNQRVVLREHIRSHHSGPDPKYGTSMTPYCCAVCSDLFSTSQDLILHLIQHCDMNTAMKRQPQVGPRKYKRRRKLKPHELERISNRLDVDDEPASESDDNSKRKLGKKNKRVKSVVDDNFESVMQGFENTMKSINTIVNSQKSTRGRKKKQPLPANDQNSMSSRPKMIHTQKTKVAVEVSDGSKVRHKTKTLITRTTPAVMSTNNLHPEPTKAVNNNERERNTERNRPRTKNVSYHVLQPEKYQVATFGYADNVEQDGIDLLGGQGDRNITIKNEPINIKKENSLDFNEDLYSGVANNVVVNDCPSVHFDVAQNIEIGETVPEAENEVCIGEDDQIEEDTNVNFKAEVSKASQRVRPVALNIVKVVKKPNRPYNSRHILGPGNKIIHILKAPEDDTPNESIVPESLIQAHQQQSVKMEPIDATSLHELAELSMQHAQNKFKCEMCSETFSDRGQLLLHVKIHI